jgi:UrcA family protein
MKDMRSLFSKTVVAIASIALSAGTMSLAVPAYAQVGEGDLPRAVVRIADLNLQSPAGQLTAERRIRRAVDRVCRTDVGHDLSSGECRRKASDAARRAIDAQGLVR